MAQATAISWTDCSSNPLKYRDRASGKDVWACVKLSSGCAHCYSEALALRYGRGGPFTRERMGGVEPYLCEKELKLLTSKKLAGQKVFVGDMTDLFGDWVPDKLLDRLFAVMALRPDVTFQVLTKRAQQMADYMRHSYRAGAIQDACRAAFGRMTYGVDTPMPWPLPNVWLGVSVENQAAADARIPFLHSTPAAVRFLSCEPLLGPVDLGPWHGLDWVICGGESGRGYRVLDPAWAASLRDQCKTAGIAFWCKQDSGLKPGQQGRIPLDVFEVKDFPNATRKANARAASDAAPNLFTGVE